MRICAIILNYLEVEKTSKCVRSLAGQGVETLYIVDNSASATEAEKIVALSRQLTANSLFPNVNVILNSSNLGFGRAVNDALRRDLNNSGHDYYLLLNNDAVAPENMVGDLLSALQNDIGLYMVSPAITDIDQTKITYFWYNKLFGHITTRPQRNSFPYISGCCLLFKKDVIGQGTLFDEDFFMYGEDVQLCKRLKDEGRTYKCMENVLVLHEGSGTSKRGSLFYEYHVARGHIILSSKVCNGTQRFLCYIGRFFYLSARGLKRTLRYKSPVPLMASILSWLPPCLITKFRVVNNG
jgi:N-acetylglucosaminyl-diphospho-decaprenol L-rhamnosyltransferase